MSTGQDRRGHRIVVGVDGSPSSEAALRWAVRQAERTGAEVEVRPHVVEGRAAQVLVDASEGADLLVVGSQGHGGFAAALGSVSQHCVSHAPCPVVVVRPKTDANDPGLSEYGAG